jgi:hypothetical protein
VKSALVWVGLFLLAAASAQRNDEPHPKGVIYGVAIGQDGQPAKRIGLTATPLGVPLSAVLPHTRSNDAGEYRFENVPWWGRYTVYGDDESEGFSSFSTGPAGDSTPPEVELTPQHPEAELRVLLPPRAGFIQIHLTNQRTGAGISGMRVALMLPESPASPLFTMSCASNHVILIPPDKDIVLHISSDGFREWNESIGKGMPVHLASGARLRIDVQLEPTE